MVRRSKTIMTIPEHPPKTIRLACMEEDEEAESPPSSRSDKGGSYQRFLMEVTHDPSEVVDGATMVPSEEVEGGSSILKITDQLCRLWD